MVAGAFLLLEPRSKFSKHCSALEGEYNLSGEHCCWSATGRLLSLSGLVN
jgi:hypothetical protein